LRAGVTRFQIGRRCSDGCELFGGSFFRADQAEIGAGDVKFAAQWGLRLDLTNSLYAIACMGALGADLSGSGAYAVAARHPENHDTVGPVPRQRRYRFRFVNRSVLFLKECSS
jgi:hypothetical protein